MPKILWAEDGLDDQYLIKHALGQVAAAPKVRFVEDGQQLLDAVGQSRPDLVVLDLNMPILDGLQTLRRLRDEPALQDLPVVVFSTAREERAVAECRRLGVLDYVQKPFHYADFTRAVAGICERAGEAKAERATQT
jgi:CheY-like chemotaxis protein